MQSSQTRFGSLIAALLMMSAQVSLAVGEGPPKEESASTACPAASAAQADSDLRWRRGDLSGAAKVLSAFLRRCGAVAQPEARARLFSDLAVINARSGKDDECVRAADVGLAIVGVTNAKIRRSLAFNRGLCGASCGGTDAAGCTDGASRRNKAAAARRSVSGMCAAKDAHVVTLSFDGETPVINGGEDFYGGPERSTWSGDLNDDGLGDVILFLSELGPNVDREDNLMHAVFAGCGGDRYVEVAEIVSAGRLSATSRRKNGWLVLQASGEKWFFTTKNTYE